MFSKDDYHDLSKYLKSKARELQKDEGNPQPLTSGDDKTPSDKLTAAARQLDAVYYEPMVVEALLEEYDVPLNVLQKPLENMPLHVNDEDIITQYIVKWRLDKGI